MTPPTIAADHDAQTCARKIRYANKKRARLAVRILAQKGERGLSAYHCPHCAGWHVGHRRVARVALIS